MATTLLGIPFDFSGMNYYQTNRDVSLGSEVVVTTPHGTFLGTVKKIRLATEEELKKPDFSRLFPRIDRIATFQDVQFATDNQAKAKDIVHKSQAQANSLKLDMKILNAYFDLDESKVLITFAADARVDFRELVHILNGMFHSKVEFRQIGTRDQARVIGGIGPCGLPLCCASFLTKFDVISISMAKNQLLSLNIPKISGQCGKLMCCLKYEDKAYSEIRPLYPKMGTKFAYQGSTYSVSGLNLLTDTITAYNGDNYESFSREEFNRVKQGLTKCDPTAVPVLKDINSGVDLSGKGISETNRRIAAIKESEKTHKEEIRRTSDHYGRNRNGQHQNSFHSQHQSHGNPNPYSSSAAAPSTAKPSTPEMDMPTTARFFSQSNPNNQNHSYHGQNNNHGGSFHGSNNSYHSHNGNNHQRSYGNPFHASPKPSTSAPATKKESGYISVSSIADRSVLDVKPGSKKSNDKK